MTETMKCESNMMMMTRIGRSISLTIIVFLAIILSSTDAAPSRLSAGQWKQQMHSRSSSRMSTSSHSLTALAGHEAQAGHSESDHRRRLSERAFGYGSGATGGAGGGVISVTNLKDAGIGSLRWACYQPGPAVINFQVSGTIKLKSPVLCLSDRTIDGEGKRVTIEGEGIEFTRQRNVIVRNLCFRHSAMDGITIRQSKDVWIDKVTVVRTRDGAIDTVQASSGVTVSHCHFLNQMKVMLVGNDDGQEEDKIQTVSVFASYFENCVSRMPRVRYGTAHVCCNVFKNWGHYVMGGSMGAKILSENNFFIHGNDIQIDHFHNDPNDGTVLSFRGSQLGTAVLNSQDTDQLGIPFSCPVISQDNILANAGVGSWCNDS